MLLKKLKFFCLGICAANAAAEPLAKESSIYNLTLKELMEVSVITAASGYEQKIAQVIASNSVITKEEWQAFGATTLSDVLKTVVGIHIGKSVVAPNHNLITIRGLGGNFGQQLKLMIDGQPMERSSDSGQVFGLHIPLGAFKRIEVVKGPGSAIYGADAFAGVINLVSTDIDEMPSNFTLRAGRFNTGDISLQHGVQLGEHKLSFSLDYMTFKDDPGKIINADQQTQLDAIFGTSASLAPGRFDEHFELFSNRFKWQWRDWSFSHFGWRNFDIGIGAGGAQALDETGVIDNASDIVKLNYAAADKFDVQQLDFSLHFYRHHNHSYFHLFPGQSVIPIGSDGNINFTEPLATVLFEDGVIGAPKTHSDQLGFKVTFVEPFDDHKIRFQSGYQRIRVSTTERKNFGPGVLDGHNPVVLDTLSDVSGSEFIFMGSQRRDFYFFSLLDEWQLSDDLLLNIGGRFDRYSDFGTTSNPRMGLSWRLTPAFKMKFFAGSAFRSPSFNELYISNNPVTRGNPELSPEKMNTLETGLGLEYLYNQNLYFNTSLFRYRASDLIEFVFDPVVRRNVAQNIGERNGKGIEFSMRYKPDRDITIQFNYTHLSANDQHGDKIANYPANQFFASMTWHINQNWHWAMDAKWIKDRTRASGDNRPELDDYVWTNSRLSWNGAMDGLTLGISVKNLFDNDAKEGASISIPGDFPLHGRLWTVDLSYVF